MSAEMDVEGLARSFHHTYERLSAGYEWQTQESCRVEFDDLPPQNRALMLAVCQQIYAEYFMPQAEENARLTEQVRVLEELSRDFQALQHALVGDTGASAIHKADTLTRQLQEAEDMANVGRSLMEQIESNAESLRGWAPLCDPAEIVVDLINQRDEAESRLQEARQVAASGRWGGHSAEEVADLVDMLANSYGRGYIQSADETVSILIRARGCIRDLLAALTERSKPLEASECRPS